MYVAAGCRTATDSTTGPDGPTLAAGDPSARIAANQRDRDAVVRVLDGWHQAASRGDIDAYFGHLAEDATFLGTDASERWSKDQFLAYTKPIRASSGGMWTIQPFDRFVVVEGAHAWIDEGLRHENYSDWRGTGVLRRTDDGWEIVHYSMTFTIPNGLSDAVKQQVLEHVSGPTDPR
tara:strand:- start:3060 stop:3590 length:531 start_codon:yes stop_codon:yes gene_type:complete